MSKLRAPSVPLITVDPYFSIWSAADHLYDDVTRHWTGRRQAMTGLLRVDGEWRRFMGKLQMDNRDQVHEPPVIPQTDLQITPLITKYTFTCPEVVLQVNFMTPLLQDDLKLLSRPVSYVYYTVASNDGKEHEIDFYFDVSAEAAVNDPDQSVTFSCDKNSCFCGRGDKDVLGRSGDNLRIEWGWLHLFSLDHEAYLTDLDTKKKFVCFYRPDDVAFRHDASAVAEPEGEVRVGASWPCLALRKHYTVSPASVVENFLCVGYDDLYSIVYFGKKIRGYWTKDGDTFADVCRKALEEFPAVRARCEAFNAELTEKALKHGEKYRDIVSLAYRQVIGAHKLSWDGEGLQFFSKECFSNGCMGTVDVTYPSIPLFLLYNPDLICGMLDPVFRFADTDAWPFEFAPHDVGQYPLANGQVYGYRARDRHRGSVEDFQMPVEECGNMLLCTAAVCHARKDASYAKQHERILQQWVDYLMRKGMDPENQLCTDDFAGHLAHNANLSVKAIMGIASWGMLRGMMGDAEGETYYLSAARKMAKEWKEKAYDPEKGCYKLAFDQPDTWSIKYNLVWDKLFGLNVFDADVFETEVAGYKKRVNAYGLPLDCRSDYTKSDWQMWSVVLTDDREYEAQIVDAMWDMLNTTPDRVPFTDWYYTSTAFERGFQNRTVQGGLFIPLLK